MPGLFEADSSVDRARSRPNPMAPSFADGYTAPFFVEAERDKVDAMRDFQ